MSATVALCAANPTGIGHLNLIMNGSPKLDERVRTKMFEAHRFGQDYNLASAHVVYLPGMAGVLTRALIGAMMLAVGSSRSTARVFGIHDEAFPWLAGALNAATHAPEWSVESLEVSYQEAVEVHAVAA